METLVASCTARRARAALLTALIVFWSGQSTAGLHESPSESVAAKVDKLFAPWNGPDSPGCVVGVSRDGVTLYEQGHGLANLELGVHITPASVFHVASVSKTFTAMSIMLLAQRGQLSLEDDVGKYITELPDYGSRLTLRHLLSHTGGLRDVFRLQGLAAPRTDIGGEPNDQFVDILAHQRALNFAPGTEYEYSNGGYLLLATIVRRVSGQSLRAFADASIFKPLGMRDTQFHDDPTLVVPNRASGYSRADGGVRVAVGADPGGIVGNAGLFTTATDLLRWERNFDDVRVGDAALLVAMATPTTLPGGDITPYGLGLEIGEYRGARTLGHSGGNAGYVARLVRYPGQKLAVAVLCNLDDIDVGAHANAVADVYLQGPLATPSEPSPSSASPSPEELAGKEGVYRDPSNEQLLRLALRDGRLIASVLGIGGGWPLTPLSATRFTFVGGMIALEFLPATNGRAQEIRVFGDRPKPFLIQQVAPSAPSRADLPALAGEYRSSELGVTYRLRGEDAALRIQIPGRADVVVQPILKDTFAGDVVGVVKFYRDAHNAVTGFTVNTSGVRRLRFDRVKL